MIGHFNMRAIILSQNDRELYFNGCYNCLTLQDFTLDQSML